MTAQLRVNVRVFEDEDPVLFHLLISMPERTRSRQIRSVLRQHFCGDLPTPGSLDDTAPLNRAISQSSSVISDPTIKPALKTTAYDEFDPADFLTV